MLKMLQWPGLCYSPVLPDAFAPGKPGGRHFEQITPKLADFIVGRAQAPCLSAFITDRSWLFFHLVGRNAVGWLQRAPEEWPQNPDYTFISEVARDMLVVNDCAEVILQGHYRLNTLHTGCQWIARWHCPCWRRLEPPPSKPKQGKSPACINKLKLQYSFTPHANHLGSTDSTTIWQTPYCSFNQALEKICY